MAAATQTNGPDPSSVSTVAEVLVVSSPASADVLPLADAEADGFADADGVGVALADALAEADALAPALGLEVEGFGFVVGFAGGDVPTGGAPGAVFPLPNTNPTNPPAGTLSDPAPRFEYFQPETPSDHHKDQ